MSMHKHNGSIEICKHHESTTEQGVCYVFETIWEICFGYSRFNNFKCISKIEYIVYKKRIYSLSALSVYNLVWTFGLETSAHTIKPSSFGSSDSTWYVLSTGHVFVQLNWNEVNILNLQVGELFTRGTKFAMIWKICRKDNAIVGLNQHIQNDYCVLVKVDIL